MNRTILSIFIAIVFFASCNNSEKDAASDKAKSMLDKMTLEEKCGQMTQLTIEMISAYDSNTLVEPHALDPAKLQHVITEMGVGSILNVGGHTYPVAHWKEIIQSIDKYSKQSRLKIPVLYGIDAIHGANYIEGSILYPQQIGLAATYNTDLVNKMAQQCAAEVSNCGIYWNFSPVLDVGRNQVWPRFWETFGEDPTLVAQMGTAMVKGYQVNKNDGKPTVTACLKHYFSTRHEI